MFVEICRAVPGQFSRDPLFFCLVDRGSETEIRVKMNVLGLSSAFSTSVCWISSVRGSTTANGAVSDYQLYYVDTLTSSK